LYASFIPLYAGKFSFIYQYLSTSAGKLFSTSTINSKPSETVCGNLFSDRFLNWLTGFIESDGSFPNEKDGTISFYISQSIKNLWLINYIHKSLGFGKVRVQPKENMCHFIIEDLPSLIKLASLLNGRFCTQAKFNAFSIWLARLNKKLVDTPIILKPISTIMDYNWLAGFTEGDGSFFINFVSIPKMKIGVQVRLNISWTQTAINRQTLDFIGAHFKCGRSYNKVNNFWVYNVSRQSEVIRLLSIFAEHPLYGLKQLDYLDLVKASQIIQNKGHLTLEGVSKLRSIAGGMNQRRK